MMSACEMYLGGSGGTRLQRDLGFEDSSENFFNYLMTCFGPHADEARVRMFVEGAAEHFDWAEGLGVNYKRGFFAGRDVVALTGDSLQFTGNEKAYPFNERCAPVPRGHLPADSGHKGGVTLMTTLMKRVEEAGADIRCDARLIGLVQDRDGRVRGGVARVGEEELFIAHYPPESLTFGIFVNDKGQRFVNEDAYLARIGHYASVQPGGRIFMFVDDAHFARPRYVLNTEIVGTGDSVAEVENEAGLPEGALQSTVALYNEHAARPASLCARQLRARQDRSSGVHIGGIGHPADRGGRDARSGSDPRTLRGRPHSSGDPSHVEGVREWDVGGGCDVLRPAGGKVCRAAAAAVTVPAAV